MKFTIPKSKIYSCVQTAMNAVPTRTTLPVLANLLLEVTDSKLKIAATDLDVSVITTTPVTSTKKEAITIPAKTFYDILRELPESDVEIHVTENKIEIKADRGNYKLSGIPAEEYPKLPGVNLAKEIKVPGDDLVKMIRKTIYAVSTDETRPALNGVLWQTSSSNMQMVATDGHRLSKMALKNTKLKGLHEDVIIPPKILNLLLKLTEEEDNPLGVIFGENSLIFNLGETILISRLIEGPYPNFDQVIPKDTDKKLVVNKELLTGAVRRMSILANTLTHQVKFSLKKDNLELSSINYDLGGEAKESVPCSYAGEPIDIGYNSSYVLDILKQLEGEEVVFELGSEVSAGKIYSTDKKEGEDYLCLLMPLRLAE
jgi:DNA polymerase-3 subunit beta